MIYLTFYHGRNIFQGGGNFKPWLSKLFKSFKFEGFEYGHYLPTISVSRQEFEANKEYIPTANLVRIEGKFDVLEQMTLGVRNFKNEFDEKVDKAKLEFLDPNFV